MKNFGKLVGIIAVAAVIGLLAGCGDKGGTLIVKNGTTAKINVILVGGTNGSDDLDAGRTKEYPVVLDSDVTVTATGEKVSTFPWSKKVRIEGGKTETVTVQ